MRISDWSSDVCSSDLLVIVHYSFPNDDASKAKWLGRFAKYIPTSERRDAGTGINVEAMKERLPVLSPEEDVATLLEAGLSQAELFYAAITFKGCVAYRDKLSVRSESDRDEK